MSEWSVEWSDDEVLLRDSIYRIRARKGEVNWNVKANYPQYSAFDESSTDVSFEYEFNFTEFDRKLFHTAGREELELAMEYTLLDYEPRETVLSTVAARRAHEELLDVNGVGADTAGNIGAYVSGNQIYSTDELEQHLRLIKGIGRNTAQNIQNYITEDFIHKTVTDTKRQLVSKGDKTLVAMDI